MNSITLTRLSKFTNLNNYDEKENAIKQIMQEIMLYALSKTDFFEKAAFYGGTALRIFHNLNRFSEDLDFTLISKSKDFKLLTYFDDIKNTFKEYGIDISIIYKKKNGNDNTISFFKIEFEKLISYFFNEEANINRDRLISIKFEIDTLMMKRAIMNL